MRKKWKRMVNTMDGPRRPDDGHYRVWSRITPDLLRCNVIRFDRLWHAFNGIDRIGRRGRDGRHTTATLWAVSAVLDWAVLLGFFFYRVLLRYWVSFAGLDRPLLGSRDYLGFTEILLSFIGFYRVLLGLTGFWIGFTRFYWVWLGLTGFDWVLLGLTGFYEVLLGFTEFDWVWLGFTGFYCVLPGLTGFDWVLVGLTGFCSGYCRVLVLAFRLTVDFYWTWRSFGWFGGCFSGNWRGRYRRGSVDGLGDDGGGAATVATFARWRDNVDVRHEWMNQRQYQRWHWLPTPSLKRCHHSSKKYSPPLTTNKNLWEPSKSLQHFAFHPWNSVKLGKTR